MRRRLSFAVAAIALAAPLASAASMYGCSSDPDFESVCLWVSDKENCFRKFRKDAEEAGNTCKPAGEPTPVGADTNNPLGVSNGFFVARGMLDTCFMSNGGAVTFDPPIDLTNYPPPLLSTPITYKMTFLDDKGGECGSASYTSPHGFSFTINPPPDSGVPTDAGASTGDAGDAGAPPLPYGSYTQVIQPGSDAFDVTCPSGESHRFNLFEVSGASLSEDGGSSDRTCPLFEQLVPQASLVVNPGGIETAGAVSFTIYWPRIDNDSAYPVADAGVDGGGTLVKTGTPLVPQAITYFNCSIGGAPRTCENGVADPNETDKDCGGNEISPGCPARCGDGQLCVRDCDCDPALQCIVSEGVKKCGVISGGAAGAPPIPVPPRDCSSVFICQNKKQDGGETDVDCGGTDCGKCNDNLKCKSNSDCLSDYCLEGVCRTPNCTDGILNLGEVDTDCGGPCKLCTVGNKCNGNKDCDSGICINNVCSVAKCTDGFQNGTETDIDCGGLACPQCDNQKTCLSNSDCKNNGCVMGVCLFPSCSDSTEDGTETDKDCGGPCSPCADGLKCGTNADCASNICGNSSLTVRKCFPTSCLVQSDAGADAGTVLLCGTGMCPLCDDGAGCTKNSDCLHQGCVNNVCVLPTCTDNVQDGTETDKDCGGSSCNGCQPGQKCLLDSDCAIKFDAGADGGTVKTCVNNVCQAE